MKPHLPSAISLIVLAGNLCANFCSAQDDTRLPAWARSYVDRRPYTELFGSRNASAPVSWLVKLKVLSSVKLLDEPESVRVKFQIIYVYSGPNKLQDQIFEEIYGLDNQTNSQLFPQLVPYSEGKTYISSVRWLIKDQEILTPDIGNFSIYRSYAFSKPVLLDGSPAAIEAEEHAKRIERVFKADKNNRKSLMMEYAAGQFPKTTNWALSSIARGDRKEGYEFLIKLSQAKENSVQKSVLIDALLISNGYDSWVGSEERSNLLQTITNAVQPDGGIIAFDALASSTSRGYASAITPAKFLSFIGDLAENLTTTPEVRAQSMKLVTKLIRSSNAGVIDRNVAFSFWKELLRKPKNVALADLIATEIEVNAPWAPEQNKELESLIFSLKTQTPEEAAQQAKVKNAVTLLQKAIEKP